MNISPLIVHVTIKTACSRQSLHLLGTRLCACSLRGCLLAGLFPVQAMHAARASASTTGCARFFGGCARRCSPRRIPCTCFFRGSLLHSGLLLPLPLPLPAHAAPSLPLGQRTPHLLPSPPLLRMHCMHYIVFSGSHRLKNCIKACLMTRILASRPSSLTKLPLLCRLAPSIACVAKATFITHFLNSMPTLP